MSQPFAALGMIEFTSIAAGIDASDRMVKAAQVQPVFFKTICPGKFLSAVSGDVADVQTALNTGNAVHPETVVDWFVIPNIHPDVVRALGGDTVQVEKQALGILETFSAASIVLAADAAVKAAQVELLDVRTALGLGGKGYALISGDVAAVEAAVNAGAILAEEHDMLVSRVVIPRPHEYVFRHIG